MAQKVIRTEYEDGQVVLSNIRNNKDFPVFKENDTVTATKVTTWYDGSPMGEGKADGKVYLRYKSTGEYFLINLPNWGYNFLEKDTMAELKGLSSTEVLLLRIGYYKGVKLNGYYVKGDTRRPIDYFISSTTEDDDDGGIVSVGGLKLEHDFQMVYNVLYFGAKGDDDFDNTAVIYNLKQKLSLKPLDKRGTIFFPRGRYRYTDLIGRVAYQNIKWEGENMDTTFIISMSGDIAFNQDADLGVLPTETRPFVNNCDVKNITISGHSGTKVIWNQNLTARGEYINVNLINADPVDGIGLQTSNMLGKYISIYCSTNKNTMTTKPLIGLKLVEGFRLKLGVRESIGRSTNNTFTHCYWEGMARGVYIKEGDTNFFVGGSPEANTEYSLYIEENNKGNSFTGVGFESNAAPYDIFDNGWYTIYSGCYSSNKFVAGPRSRGITWQSGTLQSVLLQVQKDTNNVITSRPWWPRFEQCHWNHDTARVPAATFVDEGAIRPTYINVHNRANGAFLKGYDEVNQENYYGTRYLNLASATGDTRAGNVQEYIETNFNGTQTITFKSSTEFSIGVKKTFRKNTVNGVHSIVPEAGVTFNSTTAPVTLTDLNEQVEFICVGLNSWRVRKMNLNNASLGNYGLLRQAAKVDAIAIADIVTVTTADATDATTTQALVNELKGKVNLLIALTNKNKETINTILAVQKTATQMASS